MRNKRRRDNTCTIQPQKFGLDIRKEFFTMRWCSMDQVSREVGESLSSRIFKTHLETALSNQT